MPKKSSKRKAKASKPKLDVEVISRTETKYEDTKDITGVSPKFKWGELYQMIRDRYIPDVGLEEMFLYQNIKKSGITKSTTHLELFPCSEVIGWILPQTNPSLRIISNIKKEDFASFTPAYITTTYKLPPPRVMMTND